MVQPIKSKIKFWDEFNEACFEIVAVAIRACFDAAAHNIGVADPDKLGKGKPSAIVKAIFSGFPEAIVGKMPVFAKGFLDGFPADLKQKLKSIFRRKAFKTADIKGMPPIYVKGKPLGVKEWEAYNKKVLAQLEPFISTVAEEMAVKGMLLSLAIAEQESNGKLYESDQSYDDIVKNRFKGYIPADMQSAKERYKINAAVESTMLTAYSSIGQYITNVFGETQEAIRRQVIKAHEKNLTPSQLASNMYWMNVDDPELKKHTAERISKDWHRIAVTELAFINGRAALAATEDLATESLKDPDKAVYYAFMGSGRCDWCAPRQGTIARQIPQSLGEDDDSLAAAGIESDPYAKITIWIGKNNVGKPKAKWLICSPSHPWCLCKFVRIYPDAQEYDPKTRNIRFKPAEDKAAKFIPPDYLEYKNARQAKINDAWEQAARERERGIHRPLRDVMGIDAKPVGYEDGNRIAEWRGFKYVEVPIGEVNARREARQADRSLPIPVAIGSPDHRRIFGQ